eukprot:4825688-Pyramimonas_sp.AAC.1
MLLSLGYDVSQRGPQTVACRTAVVTAMRCQLSHVSYGGGCHPLYGVSNGRAAHAVHAVLRKLCRAMWLCEQEVEAM